MRLEKKRGAWTAVAKVAVALLAGLVVLAFLFPVAIVGTLPRKCSSVAFGLGAPCDAEWSLAAASMRG